MYWLNKLWLWIDLIQSIMLIGTSTMLEKNELSGYMNKIK